LDTARAVHEEMTRLQNGIAELEAIYALQLQEQEHPNYLFEGGEDLYSDDDADDSSDDGHGGLPGNYNLVVDAVAVVDDRINFPALPPSIDNAVEPDMDGEVTRSRKGETGDGDAEAATATEEVPFDS